MSEQGMSDDHSKSKEELIQELKQLRREFLSLSDSQKPQAENTALPLTLEEYRRYGRQMIVPQFRFEGQLQLKYSKVLVIGAGGLGCPALLYLCGAGVGQIGIVDHDTVDVSNLHRQILHSTETVGLPKCQSAKYGLKKLNPNVKVVTYPVAIANNNIFHIMQDYHLVLDCTDTPATRYLINDAAVILGKQVVSGSGLKTEGQLSILNYAQQGPCYRCFYPIPPPPNSVTACSDGGVIGPVIGLVGTMMALEAIKILTGAYAGDFKPFLTLYSGYQQQSLRTFKMRGRSPKCAVCGENATISRKKIENGEIDYPAFCGRVDYNVLEDSDRISVTEYCQLPERGTLLDVRPSEQFEICSLPGSVNIPLSQLLRAEDIQVKEPVYVICRHGNDSQLAVKHLRQNFGLGEVKDIKGGLNAWSDQVDNSFPKY